MERVALIGTGTMGVPIARNLMKSGFRLCVHNRTPEKAKPLLDLGAQWAESPRAAAAQAEVVITVVGDDAASRAVWLESEGGLAGARPGTAVVECSTLSLPWVRELIAKARERGLNFADATLGGSLPVAESGALTLFVGAEPEVFEAIQPVLRGFSRTQIHFGPPGAGAAYKLINNMMAAIHMVALGEGMALAEKVGLNMEKVLQAVTSGAVSSPVVKAKAPNVAAHRYDDLQFALRWMHKDLSYALHVGTELGEPLVIAARAREIFGKAMEKGLADLDWSAVAEMVRGAP